MTPARFPHSDTPGSTLGCQLPRAYRRLLRPSSALDAKASTMCPSQLVTHTTNPTPHTTHSPQTPDRRTSTQEPDMAMHNTSHKHMTRHKEPHTPATITNRHATTTNNQTHHTPTNTHGHSTGLKDARVHYPDLKQQPHTTPTPTPTRDRPTQPATSRSVSNSAPVVPKPQSNTHAHTGPATTPTPEPGPRRVRPDSSEPQQCVSPTPPATSRPPTPHDGSHPGAAGWRWLFPHL